MSRNVCKHCVRMALAVIANVVARAAAAAAQTGTLAYTIASNPGAARSATLTVAGKTITVNQGAAAVPPPVNLRIVGVGGQ
jgi:hypothetical protein